MSDNSRDQILSDFQNFTGLEHIEECIHILQQYDWNLMEAVNAVHDRIGLGNDNELTVPIQDITDSDTSSIAKTTIDQNINYKRQSDSNDNDDSDEPRIIETIPGNQRGTQGTNNGPARELKFQIEYGDQSERVTILDNQTVEQLRKMISEKINVPPNKQYFINWSMKSYDDQTTLRSLGLSTDNVIRLESTGNEPTSRVQNHTTAPAPTSKEFTITVLCDDQNGNLIPHRFNIKPTTTIRELKQHVEKSAHIPINQQDWQGLLGAEDSNELRQTLITAQTCLIVHRSDISTNQQLPSNINFSTQSSIATETHEDDHMDIDHDSGLETYDDEVQIISQRSSGIASAVTRSSGREALMPDECTDDESALEHFTRVFHTRYGSTGPVLYIGSLDRAIQESLYSSIHTRRPLAIYLHNDLSVCANVFCSQVLADELIVGYLTNNYVVWAWDVTSDGNRIRLFETLRRCVGNQCVQRVASMERDSFPLLLIVIRTRGILELMNVIEGKSTPTEVLDNLIQSHESFEQQRLRDVDEELIRERRENLKKQQEDEYQQSIQADLAKERARQEEQDANERLKRERLQKQEESKARLPEEPSETEKNITRLKIRLPNDEGVLMRRFRITDNLQTLFDYLTTQGRMLGEYKLLTTYPKRDLTTLNFSDTFEQLKLYPQEQLILESL